MTTIINLNFDTNEGVKKALMKLKYDVDSETFNLFHGVTMLSVEESFQTDEGTFLELDQIKKNGKSIRITTNESTPTLFKSCVDSLGKLGNFSLNILECFDHEDAASSYYINSKEVSYLEYYSNLYGPEIEKTKFFSKSMVLGQRVIVNAELKKYQTDRSGDLCMQFVAENGEHFSYKGLALSDLTSTQYESKCTFFSNFEIVKKGREFISYSIFPTQIALKKKEVTSVPKFRGENKKFYNSIAGRLIDEYIIEYKTNLNNVLLSICEESICNVSFEEIYGFINLARNSPEFSDLGIEIHTIERESDFYQKPRRYVEITSYRSPDIILNVGEMYKLVNNNVLSAEIRTDKNFSFLVWSSGNVNIGLLLWETGFNLTVTHKESTIKSISPGLRADVIPSS
jgi:hypothetical protein